MKKEKEKIILVGGGGHCSSVIDVIEQQGFYSIYGIVDLREKVGQKNLGYSIIGCDDDLPKLSVEFRNFLITLGHLKSAQKRIDIYTELIRLAVHLPVIISPLAYVSGYAELGNGTVIMHMAQVNANAVIGKNCIINSKALVEHDAIIGDHCHISTGAIINGGTKVGDSSFIGSGAVCREYVEIAAGSFVKANSLVK
jgi:sugar O-acyltransferase (sialic acid O-acetyltransferase NeuD family)